MKIFMSNSYLIILNINQFPHLELSKLFNLKFCRKFLNGRGIDPKNFNAYYNKDINILLIIKVCSLDMIK